MALIAAVATVGACTSPVVEVHSVPAQCHIHCRTHPRDALHQTGGAERANSFTDADAPAYFHDWAAKIECMPPERAASTLDALAEPDRLRVQRIIDENAMERTRARGSPRSTNLPSARSRRSGPGPSLQCLSPHWLWSGRMAPAFCFCNLACILDGGGTLV